MSSAQTICKNCGRRIYQTTKTAHEDPLTVSIFKGSWHHFDTNMRTCALFATPKESES